MLDYAHEAIILPQFVSSSHERREQNSTSYGYQGGSKRKEDKPGFKRKAEPDFSPLDDQKQLSILLVTSDRQQRTRLERVLLQAGYRVMIASTGREAMRILHSWGNCSLIIMQQVADISPVYFCEDLRSQGRAYAEVPIVLIADSFDADQAVDGLSAGANDYISGPHLDESRVLLARLGAVLRTQQNRANAIQNDPDSLITIGSLVIDTTKLRVFVDEQTIDLTRIQFNLLCTLARRPGRVYPLVVLRSEIAEHGGNPDEKSVKSHIFHLRKRLGPAGNYIQTVRGLGYMLAEPSSIS